MEREHLVGCVHPKITALLGRPEAADARLELGTCERLGISPSLFRGRPTVASYIYDGDEPGRVARVVTASPWTEEDRALMLAWRIYQASICSGCGHPKAVAWHHQATENSFEVDGAFVCQACTLAQEPDDQGRRRPVTFPVVLEVHDHEARPLVGPPEPQI